jgi:hypothetical protein
MRRILAANQPATTVFLPFFEILPQAEVAHPFLPTTHALRPSQNLTQNLCAFLEDACNSARQSVQVPCNFVGLLVDAAVSG